MGSLPGNNKWTRKRATYQNIIKAKLMKRWQNFGYCLKLLWRSCLKYPFRMTHQSCNSELPQGATSHYDPTCQCFNKAYQHITLCPSFQWALTKLPHIFLLWSIVARSHQDTPGLSISFSAAHTSDFGDMGWWRQWLNVNDLVIRVPWLGPLPAEGRLGQKQKCDPPHLERSNQNRLWLPEQT